MIMRTLIRWTPTALLAGLFVLSAVPDVLVVPGAVSVFGHLGYPRYLLPFLGTAKLLGVAAVLVPVPRRLKEWAFAGLTFDLVGALYSHLSVGDPPQAWLPATVGLILMVGAYAGYLSVSSSLEARGDAEVSGPDHEGGARPCLTT